MNKNFQINVHFTKSYNFNVELYHESPQVLRFHLKCETQEMNLEKRLLEKRQPWKILSTNFQFTKQDAVRNINTIFQYLDEEIKGQPTPFTHYKNK